MKKVAQKGFTLIELMIVVAIIGILAAVAIPMFLDAMKTSKYSEGPVNLRKLTDRSKIEYNRKSQYPQVATGMTPAATCCTQNAGGNAKCDHVANAALWQAATWRALDFSMDEDGYFQYQYTGAGGQGNASTFNAIAQADMDCDTTTVQFVQAGTVAAGIPQIAQLVEPAPNSD
jgi:prepilin-type N-terminal cleavage/methylation domain-containing protein